MMSIFYLFQKWYNKLIGNLLIIFQKLDNLGLPPPKQREHNHKDLIFLSSKVV